MESTPPTPSTPTTDQLGPMVPFVIGPDTPTSKVVGAQFETFRAGLMHLQRVCVDQQNNAVNKIGSSWDSYTNFQMRLAGIDLNGQTQNGPHLVPTSTPTTPASSASNSFPEPPSPYQPPPRPTVELNASCGSTSLSTGSTSSDDSTPPTPISLHQPAPYAPTSSTLSNNSNNISSTSTTLSTPYGSSACEATGPTSTSNSSSFPHIHGNTPFVSSSAQQATSTPILGEHFKPALRRNPAEVIRVLHANGVQSMQQLAHLSDSDILRLKKSAPVVLDYIRNYSNQANLYLESQNAAPPSTIYFGDMVAPKPSAPPSGVVVLDTNKWVCPSCSISLDTKSGLDKSVGRNNGPEDTHCKDCRTLRPGSWLCIACMQSNRCSYNNPGTLACAVCAAQK